MNRSVLLLIAIPFAANLIITDVSEKQLPVNDLNRNSMDVVAADIDNDKDLDLIVACEFCPNYILLNNGADVYTNESKARLPQKRHDSEDIAAADFDNDKDIDIVFVSEDDQVNEYYINDGKGFFSDASDRFPVKGTTNGVCILDVDRDGDTDLVLGNAGQDVLLLNDGKGNWTDVTQRHFPADEDVTQDIKAFDADGDGDKDLIFGNEDTGKLYLNDGKGKFTLAAGALPPIVNDVETRKIEVHDIDKDGDEDLFYCNVAFRPGRNKQNLILLNDGKGKFTDVTATHYNGNNNMMSLDAQLFDLDNDGWKDLIVANGFGAKMQYFQNHNGKFTEISNDAYPTFAGSDIISLLHFKSTTDKDYLYLGLFRGTDKLLQLQRR